jgi:hypothetical protein
MVISSGEMGTHTIFCESFLDIVEMALESGTQFPFGLTYIL